MQEEALKRMVEKSDKRYVSDSKSITYQLWKDEALQSRNELTGLLKENVEFLDILWSIRPLPRFVYMYAIDEYFSAILNQLIMRCEYE